MWYVVGVGSACVLGQRTMCVGLYFSLLSRVLELSSWSCLQSTFFWHYLLAISFGSQPSLELLVAYELSRLTCHAACRSAAATT